MAITRVGSSDPDWPPIIAIRVTGDVSAADVGDWARDHASGESLRVELATDAVTSAEVEAAVAGHVESLQINESPTAEA